MPEVSIIVPVFNTEKWLSRCIESVLAQSFLNYELILINDGSTDGSLQILNKYETNHKITIIDKKNEGVTVARKIGVEHARGAWIFFLDSDDKITEDSIDTLFENINDDVDMIIGSYRCINKEKIHDVKYSYLEMIDCKKYTTDIIKMKIHVGIWGRLIRKNIFDSFSFDIPSAITKGEDFIMNVRLGQKCRKVILLSDIVYYYIIRDNSANKKKYEREYEKTFDKLLFQSILQKYDSLRKIIFFYQFYRRIINRVLLMYKKINSLLPKNRCFYV